MAHGERPDEGIAAWARDLGLPEWSSRDVVLRALAVELRRRGQKFGDGPHKSHGGPESQADREKALQRHRKEREMTPPAPPPAARSAEHMTEMRSKISPEVRGAAAAAGAAARRTLIGRHRDEYESILAVERGARGLSMKVKGTSKLEKLRAQVRELGGEPTI